MNGLTAPRERNETYFAGYYSFKELCVCARCVVRMSATRRVHKRRARARAVQKQHGVVGRRPAQQRLGQRRAARARGKVVQEAHAARLERRSRAARGHQRDAQAAADRGGEKGRRRSTQQSGSVRGRRHEWLDSAP